MISLPFRRPRQTPNIAALYGMIVAQARSPAFYLGYGVPDTVAGRLDMIVLHLVLLLRQLTKAQGAVPPIGQQEPPHAVVPIRRLGRPFPEEEFRGLGDVLERHSDVVRSRVTRQRGQI